VVEELLPRTVPWVREVQADGGVAARLDGLIDKRHRGLLGRSSAFPDVALEAAADDILPRRFSAHYPWNDVVEGKLGRLVLCAAILAFALVAGIDVAAIEFYVGPGEAIVDEQPDYTGNGNVEVDGADPIVGFGLEGAGSLADLYPTVEIVVGVAAVLEADDLGEFAGKERKRAPHGNDTEGHIVLVEDKYAALKSGLLIFRYHIRQSEDRMGMINSRKGARTQEKIHIIGRSGRECARMASRYGEFLFAARAGCGIRPAGSLP
jgi:hypothetical protein